MCIRDRSTTWEIRSHITCHAQNALYYLKCLWCDATTKTETYTGRAVILRRRMNTHISCCKLGNGTDIFDKHVFECRQKHPDSAEPWFQIYVFYTVKDPNMLDILDPKTFAQTGSGMDAHLHINYWNQIKTKALSAWFAHLTGKNKISNLNPRFLLET